MFPIGEGAGGLESFEMPHVALILRVETAESLLHLGIYKIVLPILCWIFLRNEQRGTLFIQFDGMSM